MFAPGVPTAAAMPANDLRSGVAQMFVPDPDLTGVRRIAERVNGGAINPDNLTLNPGPPPGYDDTGDPPLVQPLPVAGLQPSSTCDARDAVVAMPGLAGFYALRTVWYEITQDATGAPFDQSTLVTIDTAASNFASALEVFAGNTPPGAFDPNAPVLPTNIVACDRNATNGIPAVVSFVARPGIRYFLMAGAVPASLPGTISLRLSMRILDVQAPAVSIALPSTPDAGAVFKYGVSADDGATQSVLTVTQKRAGKAARNITRANLGAKCDERHMRTRVGQYCVLGNALFVRWHDVTKTPEFGRVLASYTDRAGNIGTNTLQTQLKDRTLPKLGRTNAHWTRRGRLFVSTTCSGGPGSIVVQFGANKRSAGPTTTFAKSKTMRLRKAYPRVTRRTTFIHVICRDQSFNAVDTWLFLPR
jgi:hypothetical protein